MRITLLVLLILLQMAGYGQPGLSHFTTYTTKNGLSSNSINCMVKDARNFIWLGTDEGLNRFDGTHFVSYFSDQQDVATLSGNNIFELLQYKPGQLLIGTNNGLSVFNTITNSFENNKISPKELKKGSGTYVRSLFKDRQGHIYINHSGVIDVFNDSLQYLYRLSDLPWATNLRGTVINKENWFQDSQNRIWIPTDNRGVCLVDAAQKQVYSWVNNPMHYPFMRNQPVRGFWYDEKNQVVWFGMWGSGLEKYDLKNKQHQHQIFNISYGNEASCINSINTEKNGKIICGGGQAIYEVDPETLAYEVISEAQKTSALPAFIGSCILNDSIHIWIGTETRGLLKLPSLTSGVQQVPLPYNIKDYTNFCTSIAQAKNGEIYMAYRYDGLVEINAATGTVRQYKLNNEQGGPETVIRICEDKQNRLWVGTKAGFYIFNKEKKTFSKPDWLPAFTRQLYVNTIFCTQAGNLWFSFRSPHALGMYNIVQNKFTYLKNYVIGGNAVYDSMLHISTFTEDANQNIWMTAFPKGNFLCYQPATFQWRQYPAAKKNGAVLTQSTVANLIHDGKQNVWVANDAGLGLIKYNYENDSLVTIGRKDGLLSNNILSVTRGIGNDLYIAGNAGINRYNIKTNEIRTLKLRDESINLSFAYIQFYDSISHQLVYGLNDRLLFIKDTVWQNTAISQTTFINNVKVNNKLTNVDYQLQKLQLDYSEKNVSISFASVSYSENATLQYAYKLEGADNDWIVATETPVANYTSLTPGKYRFMVKAKEEAGAWGPVNSDLQIIIAPPFWKTWWFITLTIAVWSASVYWIFSNRIKTIRHEAGLKQKVATAEMQALRAQMNPHFIFNCLNAIDNMIQTNQKEMATTYLSRFAKLIRGVLDSSKNNIVPLYKDVETLQLFMQLEQFRCNNKFEYEFNVADELLHGDYKVPPLVVQPFIENAIHHGLLNKENGPRQLTVNIGLTNDDIKYTITDNGVGRAKAAFLKNLNKPEHISYGIQISKDRIFMHNQDDQKNSVVITDLFNGHEAAGTMVEVLITMNE